MEQSESYPFVLPATEDRVEELPRWVKIFFRVYAVYLLLDLTVSLAHFLHKQVTRDTTVLVDIFEGGLITPKVMVLGGFIFAAVLYLLYILFAVGIFRLRRWSLPLILVSSLYTLVICVIALINHNPVNIAQYTGVLISMIIATSVGYLAIRYWSGFTGPARRLCIQLPLLLIVLPVLIFTILIQVFRDDPQINDADLVLQPIVLLTEADNAYYVLPYEDTMSAAQAELYEAAQTYRRGSKIIGIDVPKQIVDNYNNPEAIQLVDQTKFLTNAVILASTKKGYQCPTSVNLYTLAPSEMCPLGDIRVLSDIAALRANVEADTGNTDAAIETAVSIVKLGSLVATAEQIHLIQHLVGVAVVNIGLESLERTLNTQRTTSPEVLRNAIVVLEQSKISNDAVVSSVRREYMDLKGMYENFAPSSGYLYQHNKTVNQSAMVFRNTVQAIEKECGADVSIESQKGDKMIIDLKNSVMSWPLVSPNFIGKNLNSSVLATLIGVRDKACEANERNLRVQQLLRSQVIAEPLSEADADSEVR